MAAIDLYADRSDIDAIAARLNADDNCAFLVGAGPGRWKAVSTLDRFDDGDYCIWVRSGGALPLLRANHDAEADLIKNPWDGWTEERAGADVRFPYFGPGHPAIVWFNVRTKGRAAGAIGLSHFGWIGNSFRVLGTPAHAAVEKWWQRLRRSITKIGTSSSTKGNIRITR